MIQQIYQLMTFNTTFCYYLHSSWFFFLQILTLPTNSNSLNKKIEEKKNVKCEIWNKTDEKNEFDCVIIVSAFQSGNTTKKNEYKNIKKKLDGNKIFKY